MKTDELQNPTEKYKIWDSQENKWYRPVYPKQGQGRTEEILFSQGGEMWLRENDGTTNPGCDKLTHLNGRYKPCLYSGVKDMNEIKTYSNDVVQSEKGIGVVIISDGGAWIKYFKEKGPMINDLLADTTFENLGSALETPQLLPND